jgi:hypothetical protein
MAPDEVLAVAAVRYRFASARCPVLMRGVMLDAVAIGCGAVE